MGTRRKIGPTPQPSPRRGEGEVRCTALSPRSPDALRGSRGMEAKVVPPPGFLSLQRLYSSLCRAPQRHGALRCSRTAGPMDRPVPNTSSFKARIPHDAMSSKGHFFGLLFFGPAKKSDSPSGRRSKRPPRRRQPSGIARPEGQEQSHWMTSPSAVEKRLPPTRG